MMSLGVLSSLLAEGSTLQASAREFQRSPGSTWAGARCLGVQARGSLGSLQFQRNSSHLHTAIRDIVVFATHRFHAFLLLCLEEEYGDIRADGVWHACIQCSAVSESRSGIETRRCHSETTRCLVAGCGFLEMFLREPDVDLGPLVHALLADGKEC